MAYTTVRESIKNLLDDDVTYGWGTKGGGTEQAGTKPTIYLHPKEAENSIDETTTRAIGVWPIQEYFTEEQGNDGTKALVDETFKMLLEVYVLDDDDLEQCYNELRRIFLDHNHNSSGGTYDFTYFKDFRGRSLIFEDGAKLMFTFTAERQHDEVVL